MLAELAAKTLRSEAATIRMLVLEACKKANISLPPPKEYECARGHRFSAYGKAPSCPRCANGGA